MMSDMVDERRGPCSKVVRPVNKLPQRNIIRISRLTGRHLAEPWADETRRIVARRFGSEAGRSYSARMQYTASYLASARYFITPTDLLDIGTDLAC